MFSDGAKRIVVIKNIQSNIIEEAILVLKNEPETGGKDSSNETLLKGKKTPELLLKEAELIINNYIRENKLSGEIKKRTDFKKRYNKNKFKTNTFINLTLIGFIVLLIFLVIKFI